MRGLAIGALLAAMLALPASASEEIEQVTAFFLKAYSTGDKQVVISMLDADVEIDTGGTPVKGIQAASDKFDDDTASWGGAAHFGAIWRPLAKRKDRFESILFNVPLIVRGAQSMLSYRMIWQLEPDGWKLMLWESFRPPPPPMSPPDAH